MEIKVGDKVRVSKDAPKILFNRSICNYPEYVFEVREVEDGNADIYYGAGKIPLAAFVIPTKYLVKVDAEAKEPKFKKGDRVRSKGYGLTGIVLGVDGEYIAVRRDDGIKQEWRISMTDVVLPTEQTEAHTDANEKLQEEFARFMSEPTPFSLAEQIERNHILHRMRVISQDEFLKEINPAEHEVKSKPRYIPKIMFNTEFWVKYEADLAKELAIAYAKRGKSPLDAVATAKEIAKRLKQK